MIFFLVIARHKVPKQSPIWFSFFLGLLRSARNDTKSGKPDLAFLVILRWILSQKSQKFGKTLVLPVTLVYNNTCLFLVCCHKRACP